MTVRKDNTQPPGFKQGGKPNFASALTGRRRLPGSRNIVRYGTLHRTQPRKSPFADTPCRYHGAERHGHETTVADRRNPDRGPAGRARSVGFRDAGHFDRTGFVDPRPDLVRILPHLSGQAAASGYRRCRMCIAPTGSRGRHKANGAQSKSGTLPHAICALARAMHRRASPTPHPTFISSEIFARLPGRTCAAALMTKK